MFVALPPLFSTIQSHQFSGEAILRVRWGRERLVRSLDCSGLWSNLLTRT